MNRYNILTDKNPREIVLLRSFPCAWGKCTFCDYIEDNGSDEETLIEENRKILEKVTGELHVLEVINSGSVQELPQQTLEDIRQVVEEKNISLLYFESHWMYRHHLQRIRDFFPVPVRFKIGVETFHNDFRQKVLNKNADFSGPEEVKAFYDSPCLMVGIQGQTKEMILQDMALLQEHFSQGTINVFTDNSTGIKRDPELVQWFMKRFSSLLDDPKFEVLYEKTDFGVGD